MYEKGWFKWIIIPFIACKYDYRPTSNLVMKRNRTSGHRPGSNSLTESFNGILEDTFRTCKKKACTDIEVMV